MFKEKEATERKQVKAKELLRNRQPSAPRWLTNPQVRLERSTELENSILLKVQKAAEEAQAAEQSEAVQETVNVTVEATK